MKAAKANGGCHWSFDTDGDQVKINTAIDVAMKYVLKTVETAIVLLTNSKDTRRLLTLQACTNRLYKQADDCLKKGKTMKIIDTHHGDERLN